MISISENVILASKAGEVMEITVPVSDFQSAVAWLKSDGFKILDFIYQNLLPICYQKTLDK